MAIDPEKLKEYQIVVSESQQAAEDAERKKKELQEEETLAIQHLNVILDPESNEGVSIRALLSEHKARGMSGEIPLSYNPKLGHSYRLVVNKEDTALDLIRREENPPHKEQSTGVDVLMYWVNQSGKFESSLPRYPREVLPHIIDTLDIYSEEIRAHMRDHPGARRAQFPLANQ